MEYRTLGRSGLMVAPLCLGTMNFGGPTDEAESLRLIGIAGDAQCELTVFVTARLDLFAEYDKSHGGGGEDEGPGDQEAAPTA